MPRLRFFGGKGGVGKTTCATAYAVASAQAGHRTLLISTDPAPSVGDALRQPLSRSPRAIAGTRNRLYAVEIDAGAALEKWLSPRRAAFETVVLRGTWLDNEDVRSLLHQSLPGIDELAALMEIGRFTHLGQYDRVVVDTAPTGHTLRMFGTPRIQQTLAHVLDQMHDKHRALVAALRGVWAPDDAEAVIAELETEAEYLSSLLRDRRRTAITWITLPEPMAIVETLDGLEELRRLDIHVDTVVINRMTAPPDGACRWCATRRRLERVAVDKLSARMPQTAVVRVVHARAREPLGIAALRDIAAEMERNPRIGRPASMKVGRVIGRPTIAGEPVTLRPDLSLLMFGGKGGVGKTTCAAAAAIDLAARQPERSILVLSTDPAHSLGDVLGLALGNKERTVPGAPANLRARELDASTEFERIRARYHDSIDAFFGRFVRESGMNVTGDHQALRDLIELAPPGLDELMAIVEISDLLETAGGRPLLVVDTAPTGHALRLLEMPALVHDWVKALMAILLKYQSITPVGELGALLLRMSRGLNRLRALLADPSRTAFVVVTRTGAVTFAETDRMIAKLRQLRIPVAAVLVNALGAGTCVRCRTAVREDARTHAAIRRARRLRGCTVIVAPAVLPAPTGPGGLRAWRGMWRSEPSGISSPTWVQGRRVTRT